MWHENRNDSNRRRFCGSFRSLNVDVCEVDEATATIKPVKQTLEGVKQIERLNPYRRVQAETSAATYGMSFVQLAEIGNLAAKATEDGAWIAVRGADFDNMGSVAPRRTTFSCSARGKGRIEVRLDAPDGQLVASGAVDCGAEFKELSFKSDARVAGVHDVFIVLSGSMELDRWTFGEGASK